MEFSEVVRRRRMVRDYDPSRPVPAEVRERILANGLRGPSAGFSQGWAFLVLEGADRDRYWRITAADVDEKYVRWVTGLRRAPLLILAFADKAAYLDRYAEADKGRTDRDESRWAAPYWFVDTGMASLLMLQTVVDEGLGACFFGVPSGLVGAVKAEFGVPEGLAFVGVISIGYPAPDRRSPSLRRGRRGVAEVVHRGQWGQHTA
ncbi:nitroreductase family protein [Kribbella sp. CA-253562]|uniref:nitroreductase family protein n=1 Tax=Kribbella sp. CA-253562 TaxID=3239942 RepID=UPI003D91C853